MPIQNIIRKAEQEFPPALKQELDPIAIAELTLLSGNINTVDSNLATTGSALNTKIDNLSGYSNNTFATITNLATTGSTLANNLATTGLNLESQITSKANLVHTHTATDISDSSSAGRTLLTGATVQAQRTALDIFATSPDFSTLTGTSGNFQRVYITQDNRKIYGWNGSGYNEISPTPTGELNNIYVQNFGNTSGIQTMTTGEYNSITPLSGVVYILI